MHEQAKFFNYFNGKLFSAREGGGIIRRERRRREGEKEKECAGRGSETSSWIQSIFAAHGQASRGKSCVELPQIAVMGDTSSGKSSLLSAIAGFEIFPAHAELTTRCPVRLRMEKSDRKHAVAHIKWITDPSKGISPRQEITDFSTIPTVISSLQTTIIEGDVHQNVESMLIEKKEVSKTLPSTKRSSFC